MHSLKNAWEEELGIQIRTDVWEKRIRSCSINSRHQLIQFKVMHRLHYSKSKLHRIFRTISPTCDGCKSAKASLTHLFWTCPKLYSFWCDILKWFSDMYGCVFKPEPEIVLFGYSVSLMDQNVSVQITIMYGMIIAKSIILRLWKSYTVPQLRPV